jgi:membrane associated rhomboid family serine protease
VLVYFGFQHGQAAMGVSRGIEFRCNAVAYGLIPYEVTHRGTQLTDPYCQPQPGDEHEGHDHPRSDPGIAATAPTWLTVVTSVFMHGGVLHLAGSLLFLVVAGPPVERRFGSARFMGLLLLGGLASSAALVALAPNLPIATIGAGGAVAAVVGARLLQLARSPQAGDRIGAVVLLAAAILVQAAIADLDSAQPVAGAGGDIAYVTPVAGLAIGVLLALVRTGTRERRTLVEKA